MQHVIKKQVISLTLNKKMDAFAVQHLVSEHYWQEIVPVLQRAFDSASTEEEVIRLDRLEIDLGIIHLKEIEKGRWKEEIYKKLLEQLAIISPMEPSEKKVKKQSKITSFAEQWIFYMQHGYLPWNVLQINEDWYIKVLEAFASDSRSINKLRFLIRNYPDAATRIIFQHPVKFLESLAETLTAEKQDQLALLIDEVSDVIIFLNGMNVTDQFQKKQLVQKLWVQAFQFSASGKENLNSSKFVLHLLNINITVSGFINKLPRKFFLKNRLTASLLKKIKKGEVDTEMAQAKEPGVHDSVQIEPKDNVDEGVFIQNAGLVLLHPFLSLFFKNLQLVNEDVFRDELSHQKALYLLHYLATGSVTPKEHELVIEKILCAYQLGTPVDNSIELAVNELEEADHLLRDVIQQWEILKETSPAGLREGFLQRNGKLYTKDGSLHLQIETSSIDVLLDRLPWNLSIIKLPWMSNILKVEWR